MVLTVTVGDLKRLSGIPAADLSHDAALSAVILAEQPVWEWALDPGILARSVSALAAPPALDFPGLAALLVLGVAEGLAGSYLSGLGRFPHVAEPLPVASLAPQAAPVLAVAVADVKRLLSVDPADSSQDLALAALITAEQLALEYALDPAVLAAAVSVVTPNAGLKAWLTLGVTEQLAGAALSVSGRVPGIFDDVQISSLHFTTSRGVHPDKLGADLTAAGTARLAPFSRHIRAEHALKPVLNQPDLVKLGQALTAQGAARLDPYRRAKRAGAVDAAGPGPDGSVDVPLVGASSVLPGSLAAPAASSSFVAAFADVGDVYSHSTDPHPAELEAALGEGMVFWGS